MLQISHLCPFHHQMDVGHLLKIDPASTGATARRLSRGKSPLKGRGARGGAGAVEPGLTLHLIPLRGSSKAAGLWYRNRDRTCSVTRGTAARHPISHSS
ncbi:DNA replication licensing factor mcm5-B [Trichinella pseudospiralis]